MDAAIQAFLVTIAIIGGILSPIIVILVLGVLVGTISTALGKIALKLKELEKAPPFDDVEANLNPMTKVLSVRFYKRGKVLWQGSATRNDQEAYDTIPFSKDGN